MLKIENVSKSYKGGLLANDDISFTVENGQVAVLLGPNGAGKSTIIKCICGLLRFDGSIKIDDFNYNSLEAKRNLGYIPEIPNIYDLLTVSEHLEFIARAYGLKDWQNYGNQLLERFELTIKANYLGKELSKGMQQKLSIICAILPRPKNLIFDEPMVGLDPHAIKELKLLFQELKEDGASLLISTHLLNSVENSWDIAHIMKQGRFAASRYHQQEDISGQSLEDLFFAITEGNQEGGRE